ncbi:hypothetical protein [Paenibacillus sp. GCM10027626]
MEGYNLSEVKQIKKTKDEAIVNALLEQGWILVDFTRGNMDHSFLLVLID